MSDLVTGETASLTSCTILVLLSAPGWFVTTWLVAIVYAVIWLDRVSHLTSPGLREYKKHHTQDGRKGAVGCRLICSSWPVKCQSEVAIDAAILYSRRADITNVTQLHPSGSWHCVPCGFARLLVPSPVSRHRGHSNQSGRRPGAACINQPRIGHCRNFPWCTRTTLVGAVLARSDPGQHGSRPSTGAELPKGPKQEVPPTSTMTKGNGLKACYSRPGIPRREWG